MRERTALILKIVCLGLAVALAWELVMVERNLNPLADVTIPAVPSLPADTNAPPAVASKPPVKPGTNGTVVVMNTNGATVAQDTNAAPGRKSHPGETNAVTVAAGAASTNAVIATNVTMISPTNAVVTMVANTNAAEMAATNSALSNSLAMASAIGSETNVAATNLAVVPPTNAIAAGTNVTIAKLAGGTNLAVGSATTNLTNSARAKAASARPSPAMMPGVMGGPGGKQAAKLSPEIQARVDRVTESEILAPIVHPMPMALLGIAGQVAFLRSPSGQTGMVKEGEDLGEIKLLRIGTNRVLVEQDGKKQELMIFSGLGGESLLSKTNETSDETTKH